METQVAFDTPWSVTDLNAARLLDRPPSLFFHARKKLAEGMLARRFALLAALADHAAGRGVMPEVLIHSGASRALIERDDRHLHILMEDAPLFARNVFHAVPAYLRGYWYFDEVASRNNSSHRLRPFNPGPMSGKFAKAFADKLRSRFIGRNFSKFDQAPRGADIATGCIVFFAQDFSAPRHYRNFMTGAEMLDALIAASGGRKVYVKAHPNQPRDEVHTLARQAEAGGAEMTDASIHDLLAAADVCVTLTSAVGFEALMHHTPVVLGGQTDFGQCAVTLTDAEKMAGALEEARARNWEYDKFLTWFLKQNCVEDAPASLPKILARIYAKGFTWADAGKRGFY